jgi:hypothetical protein
MSASATCLRALAALGLAACGLSAFGTSPAETSNDVDAAVTTDAAPSDSKAPVVGDAARPADGASVDAAPVGPIFGDECPTGTSYVDDFSSDPKGRWIEGAGTWTWSATDKTLTVTNINPNGVIWIGARPKWVNYSVEMSIKVDTLNSSNSGNAGPLFRITNFGAPPYPNNAGQMFLGAVVLNGSDDVIFGTENDGWTQNNQIHNGATPVNQWLTIRTEAQGQAIKVYTNDTLRLSMNNSAYAFGSIGIKSYNLALSVRRVEVKCL